MWKKRVLLASLGALAGCSAQPGVAQTPSQPHFSVVRSQEEWRKKLTPEQFQILRQKGTERAFSGKYFDHHEAGEYFCAGCGELLFTSQDKFDSGTGWPSFLRPSKDTSVLELVDNSYGMERVEVECAQCGGHLGHVFPDGPRPTGLRYCINSASLDFKKR
ncbi:MAG: peptide-methionine (R)-S-oxide reductase MsrB [Candidatus Eremiobacteraeota bacterium]|nr:peptide-methionine (R)-S-oxide reductase MsrB [Candidatus Eremiobacteraeota bacterium]MCW5870704.1 peptide-methionine (R)-S-oxide reductase MsrB [Candidatus Eremiobacteraeota bacterium]